MAAAKKKNIIWLLIFLFLVIFPFGQLFKFNLNILGVTINILVLDSLALLFIPLYIFSKKNEWRVGKSMQDFILICLFSLLFSYVIFGGGILIRGIYYFIRIFAYFCLFSVSFWFFRNNLKEKEKLFNSLLLVLVVTAVFGLVQYLFLPDFRQFKVWGWDDHLGRLFATFFDPGFAGIILVFGCLLSLAKYLKEKKKIFLVLLLLFLLTIALTYSRAAYLALFSGVFCLSVLFKNIKATMYLAVIFLVIVLILPRNEGVGVQLERTFSIDLRLENYRETLDIWKKSPVFGIGFNNFCLAKIIYLNKGSFASHSCSGSDSSLLLILATTGTVGFIVYLTMLVKILNSVGSFLYGKVFLACFVAVTINSLFINSLFYPHVMGFLELLAAISLTSRENI